MNVYLAGVRTLDRVVVVVPATPGRAGTVVAPPGFLAAHYECRWIRSASYADAVQRAATFYRQFGLVS